MATTEGTQTWRDDAPRKPEPYHFTSDELRVLKECNRESFYQRSLPISSIFGAGTYFAIQAGYLKPSQRFGVVPKVFLSMIAGYFLGKMSYQKKCAEKMMQLPNSALGEMLRKRRQQAGLTVPSFTEPFGLDTNISAPVEGSPTSSESYYAYSEHGPRSMDLDITQPLQGTLDIGTRPPGDAFLMDEEPLPAAQSTTTYDELRRQNREEYEKRRSRGLPGLDDPSLRRPPTSTSPPPAASPDQNQYGDTWLR